MLGSRYAHNAFQLILASEKVCLVPNARIYYEFSNEDLWNNATQLLTGGKVAFLQIGPDFYITQTTLNLVYQHPIPQNLNRNQILKSSKLRVEIIRNFKL